METNFYGALKAKFIEQVIKSNNKKSKKEKEIAKNFNEKCFTCNNIGHLAKDYRNEGQQENPKKKMSQANVIEVDHLTNKVSKINLFCVVF